MKKARVLLVSIEIKFLIKYVSKLWLVTPANTGKWWTLQWFL